MPIYEYRCNRCRRPFSSFVRSMAVAVEASCPHCGSSDLTRLISRFAVIRSEDARLEAMSDVSQFGDVDENDPRSMAQWARRFGQEMGEDLGPEFDQMVGQLEEGQMPEDWDDGGDGDGLDDLD